MAVVPYETRRIPVTRTSGQLRRRLSAQRAGRLSVFKDTSLKVAAAEDVLDRLKDRLPATARGGHRWSFEDISFLIDKSGNGDEEPDFHGGLLGMIWRNDRGWHCDAYNTLGEAASEVTYQWLLAGTVDVQCMSLRAGVKLPDGTPEADRVYNELIPIGLIDADICEPVMYQARIGKGQGVSIINDGAGATIHRFSTPEGVIRVGQGVTCTPGFQESEG